MSLQTEARPRRLIPRYPLTQAVRVRPPSGPMRSYPARDVSTGGLFLATEDPLELFSDVQLEVDLPGGRRTTLSARVVHVLSGDKARRFGLPAGIGVQFENLSDAQHASVSELVEWARKSDPRPRIPRLKTGADLRAAQREPMLSFLLEHIDGERDPEALSQELALEVSTIERMLEELCKLSAIELVSASQPERPTAPPTAATPSSRPRAPLRPPTAAAERVASPAQPKAAANVQTKPLEPAVADQLALLEGRLPNANHYSLLGVSESASPAEIRAAWETRDSILRPSIRPTGEAQRIERVLGRLREAYGVLSSPHKRAEYDDYLSRAKKLAEAEAARARLSPRPEQPERTAATRASDASPRAPAQPAARKPAASEELQPGAAARILVQAEQAHNEGRMEEAHRHVKLLAAMTFDDSQVQARFTQLRTKLARTLAVDFEKQAAYEEKQQRWALAAQSWLRVAEGRPSDSLPLQRAALAQLQAGAELRQVMELAKRAVDLAPSDAQAHRTLARVYLAANMQANARRELEAAQRCTGQAAPPAAVDTGKQPGLFKRLLG